MPLDSAGCLAASLPWPFESSAIARKTLPGRRAKVPRPRAKAQRSVGSTVPEDSMMCLFRFYDVRVRNLARKAGASDESRCLTGRKAQQRPDGVGEDQV